MDTSLHIFKVLRDHRRLDILLSQELPMYSRSFLQKCLKQGLVTVDGQATIKNKLVVAGSEIAIKIHPTTTSNLVAEPLEGDKEFEVVHSSDDLIVINKPVGLVCHPGAGIHNQTLLNGLLYRFPELKKVERCGLIHRLDKETSGLLLVARHSVAHNYYTTLLKNKLVHRSYHAMVLGNIVSGGTISAPLGRDPYNRLRRAIKSDGKSAVTHFTVKNRYHGVSELEVVLETGRTHQIRIHLASKNNHIIGDKLYGKNSRIPKGLKPEIRSYLMSFKRPALHAYKLSFTPLNAKKPVTITQEEPTDYKELKSFIARQ